ncbi:hypothetical protein GCM10009087_31190 [Sphingomonas oligophenolica]
MRDRLAPAKQHATSDQAGVIIMAADGDIKVHEATYHKVIAMLKWGAVGCFVIAFTVIWLISGK